MKHLFRLSSEILNSINLEDIEKTFDDMVEMKIAYSPFREYSLELSEKFLSKLGEKICGYKKDNSFWPQNFDHGYFFKYSDYPKEYKKEINHFGKLVNSINGEIIPDNHGTSIVEIFFIRQGGVVVSWNDYETYGNLNGKNKNETEYHRSIVANIALKVRQILIVLLATKNHVKEERVNKDLAQGRFNKKQAYRKDYPITTTISIGKITETYESKGGTGTAKRPHMRRGHIRTQHYGPKNELTQKIFIQPVFVNADEGWIAERRAYNVGK